MWFSKLLKIVICLWLPWKDIWSDILSWFSAQPWLSIFNSFVPFLVCWIPKGLFDSCTMTSSWTMSLFVFRCNCLHLVILKYLIRKILMEKTQVTTLWIIICFESIFILPFWLRDLKCFLSLGFPSWATNISNSTAQPDASLSHRKDYLGWKYCANWILLWRRYD